MYAGIAEMEMNLPIWPVTPPELDSVSLVAVYGCARLPRLNCDPKGDAPNTELPNAPADETFPNAEPVCAPKAGVAEPNTELLPKAGADCAPKAGVDEPKGEAPPNADEVCPKADGAAAPNAGVAEPKAGADAPKAGVDMPKVEGAVEPNGCEAAPKAGWLAWPKAPVAPPKGLACCPAAAPNPNAGLACCCAPKAPAAPKVAGVLPKAGVEEAPNAGADDPNAGCDTKTPVAVPNAGAEEPKAGCVEPKGDAAEAAWPKGDAGAAPKAELPNGLVGWAKGLDTVDVPKGLEDAPKGLAEPNIMPADSQRWKPPFQRIWYRLRLLHESAALLSRQKKDQLQRLRSSLVTSAITQTVRSEGNCFRYGVQSLA